MTDKIVSRSDLYTSPQAKARADIVIPEDEEGQRKMLMEHGYDPDRYILKAPSGLVFEKGKGGAVTKLRPGSITRENTHAMAERRVQIRIEAMEEALKAEIGANELKGNLVEINRAVIRVAQNGHGIAQTKSVELIYRLLGMLGNEDEDRKTGGGVSLVMDAGSMEALRDIIVTLRGTDGQTI